MPYLRLSSLPLDDTTKRYLADELTATVLDILPDEKPEWTSVHFTPFAAGDFAVGGRLVADGAVSDTHLELSAPGVDEKSWFALRNRLTDVLVDALAIPDAERWHVNVKLNRYDPHSYAIAGNASDEVNFGEGAEGDVPRAGDEVEGSYREGTGKYENLAGRSPGWRIPGVLVGFALGAFFAFRWLSGRVGSDTTVDAAEPEPSSPATGPARSGITAEEAREY